MTVSIYKFKVTGADGEVWGSFKVSAETEKAATKRARELLEEDVNKTFLPRPFTLKLMTEDT